MNSKSGWHRFFSALVACLCLFQPVRAENEGGSKSLNLDVVDVPTAEVREARSYSTDFRLYSGGGILGSLLFGVMRRINVGVAFDVQRVISTSKPNLVRPSFLFKFRFFDGSDFIPALALGYDNRGYLYQEPAKQFLHREKGLYLVGSHEIFLPDMEAHLGVNIFDFDSDSRVFGFLGVHYPVVRSFHLLAEWDHIRNTTDSHVNLGGRYYVTPYFNVDLAARVVGRGEERGEERIVRINYVGKF